MGNCADVILAEAYSQYFSCQYKDAFDTCARALLSSPTHFASRELHVSLLFALKDKNALFSYAHSLVSTSAGRMTSAVGCFVAHFGFLSFFRQLCVLWMPFVCASMLFCLAFEMSSTSASFVWMCMLVCFVFCV